MVRVQISSNLVIIVVQMNKWHLLHMLYFLQDMDGTVIFTLAMDMVNHVSYILNMFVSSFSLCLCSLVATPLTVAAALI